MAGDQLLAAQHGRGWRRKISAEGRAGAMLWARGLYDLHAWVEAHRRKD